MFPENKPEVDALKKPPEVLSCIRCLILTYCEQTRIEDDYGTIEAIPAWKRIFGIDRQECPSKYPSK